MVVKVEQIREGGLTLKEPVSLALLEEVLQSGGNSGAGFKAGGPSELDVTLQRVSGSVLLRGQLSIELQAPCKRCLKDVVVSLPVGFTLNLVPRALLAAGAKDDAQEDDKASGGEPSGSFDLAKADEEVFDGQEIDLEPIVREQVLLALPMDVVCGEDCKGLCPNCGQNRNEGTCACEVKVVDPRWAGLKNIKLN